MLILSDDKNISHYFDEAIHKGADMKQAINWIVGMLPWNPDNYKDFFLILYIMIFIYLLLLKIIFNTF